MILKTHNEFVIFDIGERYIKAILLRTNWDNSTEYVYATKIPSKGIVFNSISNLRALSDALFQLIYRIEIDVGTTVKLVAVVFSCCNFEIKKFQTAIGVNGIVKEEHMQNINYRLNFGIEKTIVGFFYKRYQLDNLSNIENPLHMCGSNLSLNASFVIIDGALIRNLITSFNRNEISVKYIGNANLITQTLIHEDNFVTIDIGYENSRAFIKAEQDQIANIVTIPFGFKHLLELIAQQTSESIDKCETLINISYSEQPRAITDLCRKFFKNLFSLFVAKLQTFELFEKSDINIYLINGITTIPLIDMFLRQTINRNFVIYEVTKKFSCIYNRNIFCNIMAVSNYIINESPNEYMMMIE